MTDNAKVVPQTSFSEDYQFVSACTHCGNPMGHMSIDRWDSIGPGRVEKRRVFKMWIDPQHECTYLKIEPAKTEISA